MNTAPSESKDGSPRTVARILIKALVFFLLFNLLFLRLDSLPILGRISAYNVVYPGRLRLPFGEDLERSYNISILQPGAMLRSHVIGDSPKSDDEFRVVLIGDSSVWGFNLGPNQTLSAAMNQANLHTPNGERVRVYNLGYPTMSITKDLFFLELGLKYQPDMIFWFITLESMPRTKQLNSPVLQYNADMIRELIQQYDLNLDPQDSSFIEPTLYDRTLVGQRRELADWVRLQLLGVMWAATGMDHDVPQPLPHPSEDVDPELAFQGFQPEELSTEDLSLEVISAGIQAAGEIPVLLVNEPIFIARGENHEVRYNSFYPRWAYDQYRIWMGQITNERGWMYLDLWDLVAPDEFTDSAIHYSPEGVRTTVERLIDALDPEQP
jgi:hypothetical protein